MAASRKPPSVDLPVDASALAPLRGKRVAVGLSGGLDSVVLLHLMHRAAPAFGVKLSALHVNHGLSPNAGEWQKFCAQLCRVLGVPFKAVKVKVRMKGEGLEAAAREARRAAFSAARAEAIALAHHLDDQAETVLFNLLRGTGLAGASGMPAVGRLGRKQLVRPLLGTPRAALRVYAAGQRLSWIEDESNQDETLTRNFLRRRVGPLLETRFPRWRENLARAARHFGDADADANALLRAFLRARGLKAPSEAKLVEMLKQLGAGKGTMAHDGALLRVYRGRVAVKPDKPVAAAFKPRTWRGESRMALPGGELNFRTARGQGIDRRRLEGATLQVRPRSGGERLRPRAGGPSRTLKNLFQEASVPPWERERMPLLFCGEDLVWAPVLGVDAAYRAPRNATGLLPEWRPA
jgi:tRNA(Ile)-lysidine synthase